MNAMDVNCMTGTWPFRRLRKKGLSAIAEAHEQNGITHGLCANMNAIFYVDPQEADLENEESPDRSFYAHVVTINPMLPDYETDLEQALQTFDSKAVRIYPGYHGYSLVDNAEVEALCDRLAQHDLPLIISLRLEDERIHPIMQPVDPTSFGLFEFLKTERACRILLCTIRIDELLSRQALFQNNDRIWYDTSGLKDRPQGIVQLVDALGDQALVYGSQYPLFSMRSTMYLVQKEGLAMSSQQNILWNNAQRLLGSRCWQ